MRFEEAYSGWQAGRLTQEEAARLLGLCARSFRRHLERYEEAGLDGLIDKRMSQVSQRRAPVDEVMAVTEQYSRGGRRDLSACGVPGNECLQNDSRGQFARPPRNTGGTIHLSIKSNVHCTMSASAAGDRCRVPRALYLRTRHRHNSLLTR